MNSILHITQCSTGIMVVLSDENKHLYSEEYPKLDFIKWFDKQINKIKNYNCCDKPVKELLKLNYKNELFQSYIKVVELL